MCEVNADKLTVVNCVGSGDIGIELDLTSLVEDLTTTSSSYSPERFPGLKFRFDESMPTYNLFSSGKYSIVGAESRDKLHSAQSRLVEELSNLEILPANFSDEEFEVANIVCTYDIGTDIDLNKITLDLGLENAEYEPEQSPFVVYKPRVGGATITIPANGRIMITGLTDKEDALTTVENLVNKLDINND